MTYLKLKSALVTATVVVAVGAGLYEAHEVATLRDQVQTLQQQQAPLEGKIQQLNRERDDATNRLATLAEELAKAKVNDRELIKLRGEVGVLRAKVGVAKNKAVQPIAAPQPTASAGHRPGVYIEKDQLAFAGYATPEAAIESIMWCGINGAYDQLIEGLSPEDQVTITREKVEGQHDQLASTLKGLQIISKKILADDKVEIKFQIDAKKSPNEGFVSEFEIQPMVKIGNGWKMEGKSLTKRDQKSWEETGEIQTFAP